MVTAIQCHINCGLRLTDSSLSADASLAEMRRRARSVSLTDEPVNGESLRRCFVGEITHSQRAARRLS